jgi:hypothetical protein
MIPIFLWSVVVTQDVQPVGSGFTSWTTICGSGAMSAAVVVVAMVKFFGARRGYLARP